MSLRAVFSVDGKGVRFEADPGQFKLLGHTLRARGHRPRREGLGWRVGFREAAEILERSALPVVAEDAVARAIENRRLIDLRFEAVTASMQEILDEGKTAAQHVLADVTDRLQVLDDHQLVAAAVMTVPDGWGACVFDEQGTGKTVTTMAAFDILAERGEVDLMVVVSPKSMLHEWKAEFGRFYGELYKVQVIEGSRRERAQVLRSGPDVIVVNYEGVVAHEADLRLVCQRRGTLLAVDESFFVKNPDARRSMALTRLREYCRRAFVLCGTPAPNHPRDLIAQFDLVDFGRTFEGAEVDDDRPLAASQVRARLDSSPWIRNRKEEVLDLPDRTFEDVEVPMEPQQRSAYEAAEERLLVDLRRTTDAEFAKQITHFLAQRSLLLQIASNPTAVVPGYDRTPGKWAALDSLLGELLARGEKVVVWSYYRASLSALAQRYRQYGLVRVDGGTVGRDRRSAVDRFQNSEEVRIFLANPAAAGAGLTLHASRIAVYESLSNQAAHYLQSLDRIHRRGQSQEVRYVTLLSEGTIEVTEYERLVSKARQQGSLLGDPDRRPATRTQMLDDILRRRSS